MCGGERPIVGYCALDPVRLDGKTAKIPPAEFCALPCNGGNIRRERKQLFHNRLAPRIDKQKSVFVSGRRKGAAISQSSSSLASTGINVVIHYELRE
jgi:hypothetical protein